MNKILGLIVLLMASLVQAAPLQDVQFDDIAFKHAWENKESIITNEYVEEGQTLDNWQHLLAYRQYPGHDEPAEVIRQYLTQIKPTQKPAVYKRDESSKDIILVFLVEAVDKSHMEFNIHRFVAEDGIVRSYQFAARNFKRKLSALGDEISEKKSKWISLVGRLKAADFTN